MKGDLLKNGHFIFSWENDGDRKMVLTQNHGKYVESGYMKVNMISGSNWKDPTNWMERSTNRFYSIINFVGKRGISSFLSLDSKSCVNYRFHYTFIFSFCFTPG